MTHECCSVVCRQQCVVLVIEASGWNASTLLTCPRAKCCITTRSRDSHSWVVELLMWPLAVLGVIRWSFLSLRMMKMTSELPQNHFDRTHHSLQFDLTRQAMCCIREARLSYSSISICRNSSHISGFDAPFVSRERRLACLKPSACSDKDV